MSATEAVKSSKEYMNVPIVELIESSTNPRKVFDESVLEELAGSIRSKGVLSPLLVRPVNDHLKLWRAHSATAPRSVAGLEEDPGPHWSIDRLGGSRNSTSSKMCNASRRASVRGGARVSRLLGSRGANYTIEKIAAGNGKARIVHR